MQLVGQFDPHHGQKDNDAERNEQPESEPPKKRESAMREEFFISSGNVVTAASPPYQFVTRRLSLGQTNSHSKLSANA